MITKNRYIKKICIAIAIIVCLSATTSPFIGCGCTGPQFYDFRANWVYESEDMSFTITTRGDSYYYLNGSITIDGTKTDVIISAFSPTRTLTFYKIDEIDTSDANWLSNLRNHDSKWFFCSYSGYKKKLTLSYFTKYLPDNKYEHFDDKKIVLKRYDY